MSEWLGKSRIEEEDIQKSLPSLVKYFPMLTRFYVDNQKMRIILTLPYEEGEKFKEAVKLLVRLAEVEAVITSLSRELSRIKRRVNALDKVIIPRIKADIAFIEFRLEETEREDLFRIRRIAQRSSG